ncbi:bolA-like family protein [Neorickettsia helminthoeca str. Oregon]|uniref:BolA-like family protein n=1 Tax=Neorickettsia helminthoeca str. Oregon TaxID=1286528 RepID=X5HJA5_9RICK|nr:BolA/IbaG family iron-sulfur metabolism protein [Neorickettsia helminthoeca]AHX11149.1 bolA-like family protein [Neorickettsia helminthoeca str. Oregon]
MPVQKEEILDLLIANFPDVDPEADIALMDTVGDGDHYHLRIRSSRFIGKASIQRHRLVVSALGELLKSRLHSISIETEIKK